MSTDTAREADAVPESAPDGSTVRPLLRTAAATLATFTLGSGAASLPVQHRTVTELWYVLSGAGVLWRRTGEVESTVDLVPDVAAAIPPGTAFQFRCTSASPLRIVATTVPPWPGESEAVPA